MTEQKQFEFKLLRGSHAEGKDERGKQIVYNPGDTILTNSDLRSLDGGTGVKVQLVNEHVVKPPKTAKA